MANQIFGKIEAIKPTREIISKDGVSKFYRRELWLDCSEFSRIDGSLIENHAAIEFGGDKCATLDNFAVGQRVAVKFSLRGRTYTDKNTGELRIITSVEGWSIEEVAQRAKPAAPQAAQQAPQPQPMAQPMPTPYAQQPQYAPQTPQYAPAYQQPYNGVQYPNDTAPF